MDVAWPPRSPPVSRDPSLERSKTARLRTQRAAGAAQMMADRIIIHGLRIQRRGSGRIRTVLTENGSAITWILDAGDRKG